MPDWHLRVQSYHMPQQSSTRACALLVLLNSGQSWHPRIEVRQFAIISILTDGLLLGFELNRQVFRPGKPPMPDSGPPEPPHEAATARSPVEIVLAELRIADPKWPVDLGQPENSDGWIDGTDFACATDGPFHSLLERTATRLRTADRRTVAALFALRFGWAASVAIAPFLIDRCVPRVCLSNISLKFRTDTLFERAALHLPAGVLLKGSGPPHPLVAYESEAGLLTSLRRKLHQQSEPVVDALYEWSGFSRKGSWGMITSSWAAHFIGVCGRLNEQMDALPIAERFFEGDDEIARMKPRLNPVSLRGVTHVYQRRASCCRYYLLPQGDLCASCPLVSDDERTQRNTSWMEQQLSRASK
jgi:FhuF 2Fe-2S C-terminal domain